MIILGLTGQARSGKDSVADYLVECYGFVKLSFAHALREEVRLAYGLEDQSLFLNSETKDEETDRLSLRKCGNPSARREIALYLGWDLGSGVGIIPEWDRPFTPRQVLQWWGTEYRRAQDANYWINQLEKFVRMTQEGYPEQRRQHFVVSDVRFENERRFIKGCRHLSVRAMEDAGGPVYSWQGNIWHIRRDGITPPGQGHASAVILPVLEGERELWNNSTIENLYKGIELLMSTSAPVVRCEPMEDETREISQASWDAVLGYHNSEGK